MEGVLRLQISGWVGTCSDSPNLWNREHKFWCTTSHYQNFASHLLFSGKLMRDVYHWNKGNTRKDKNIQLWKQGIHHRREVKGCFEMTAIQLYGKPGRTDSPDWREGKRELGGRAFQEKNMEPWDYLMHLTIWKIVLWDILHMYCRGGRNFTLVISSGWSND